MSLSSSLARLGGRVKYRLAMFRLDVQKVLTCQIPTRYWHSVKFPHPVGIVIGDGVRIGKNVQIYQNVTIGLRSHDAKDYPEIEDDVFIYTGAMILGGIRIGRGSEIGAHAIVTHDVPPGSLVKGVNEIRPRPDSRAMMSAIVEGLVGLAAAAFGAG